MGRPGRKRSVHRDKAKDKIPRAPSIRLRALLRLVNNPTLFHNLKVQLYRIADRLMDFNCKLCDQPKRVTAVEDELLTTFPDIFDVGSECHELAMRMIVSYFHGRRYHENKATKQKAPAKTRRSYVMSITMPTRPTLDRDREAVKKQKEKDFIDLTLDGGEYDEKPKNNIELLDSKLTPMMDISNRPVTIKRAPHSPSPGPSTLWSPAALINSQNTPLHAESSFQARSKNASFIQGNHEDVFQLTGVTRVARFLNACTPPMAHFLHHFIDFGCTSEEYLAAVSTWPTDKISLFLSQVVRRGSDEREFSQMDMLILQNHFISYFNKAQT